MIKTSSSSTLSVQFFHVVFLKQIKQVANPHRETDLAPCTDLHDESSHYSHTTSHFGNRVVHRRPLHTNRSAAHVPSGLQSPLRVPCFAGSGIDITKRFTVRIISPKTSRPTIVFVMPNFSCFYFVKRLTV